MSAPSPPGLSLAEVARLLGHTDQAATAWYAHLAEREDGRVTAAVSWDA